MEHKLQDREISPIKRRGNNWGKKIMTHSMDLHNKPAAPEEAIPENDKHENEELEMQESMAKRANIMDMHSKPATTEKTIPTA